MAQSDITPSQCRAARALIEWSREDLAEASRVGLRTLVDFERGARAPRAVTLDALRRALEVAGVLFLDQNGAGEGVRMRRPRSINKSPRQTLGTQSDK
jgi:transcriptional regulator with XRE-family HTH domain